MRPTSQAREGDAWHVPEAFHEVVQPASVPAEEAAEWDLVQLQGAVKSICSNVTTDSISLHVASMQHLLGRIQALRQDLDVQNGLQPR